MTPSPWPVPIVEMVPSHQVSTGLPPRNWRRKLIATSFSGRKKTTLPALSTIIGPRWPGPVRVARKRWPGAGWVSVETLIVGGRNVGSLTYEANPDGLAAVSKPARANRGSVSAARAAPEVARKSFRDRCAATKAQ